MQDRPIGIMILSILKLLGGIWMIGIIVQGLSSSAPAEGTHTFVHFSIYLAMAIFSFATAVGLWSGTRWGWWCAVGYFIFMIIIYMGPIITFFTEGIANDPQHNEYYYAKVGAKAIFNVVLFLYFFNRDILDYFRMEDATMIDTIGTVCRALTPVFVVYIIYSLLA